MLVPGCPPGLFTKQFAEFAPSRTNSGVFAQVQPQSAPPPIIMPFATAATAFVTGSAANPMPPHTFPYLVDKFFYTGASSRDRLGGNVVGSPTGDGWFKMFEFFEVPSQMLGAIGPVAQGTNFDWQRQDTRPGLLNLNLIIDEEAFFSVTGRQDANFNQQWLNFIQVPSIPAGTYSLPLNGKAPIPQYGPPMPLVVTAIDANGSPAYVYPITNQGVTATDPILAALNQGNPAGPSRIVDSRIKAAFAQFLWLRHGGSGYLFGFGNGAVGQNNAVVPIAPAEPDAGRLRLGHPGGASIPLALVSRHRLHGDAPGDAPAVAVHQPTEHGPDLLHGRSGREESQSLPGIPDADCPDGQRGGLGRNRRFIPARSPSAGSSSYPTPTSRATQASRGIRSSTTRSRLPRPRWRRIHLRYPRRGAASGHGRDNGTPVTFAFNQGYPNLVWSIWPGNNFPGFLRSPGDQRRPGPAERPQLAPARHPGAPVLADRNVAARHESDNGADPSVRRLDHRRVLRGEAAG